MQALDAGRVRPSQRIQRHLDLCLDCRACETVCPSGVQYGQLIESYRTDTAGDVYRKMGLLGRLIHRFTLHVLSDRRRTRWLLQLARLAQTVGLFEFLRAADVLPHHQAALRFPETLDAQPPPQDEIPRHTEPATSPARARVGLFLGCVGESILGGTNRATRRVLLHNNCAVTCPAEQVCCGAIHYHAGDRAQAAAFARANIETFEALGVEVDSIVVNVAGCGLMLKEYGALLSDDPRFAEKAKRFAEKVKDVNEFLFDLGIDPPPPAQPVQPASRAVGARVAYHHACHLCHGQKIWDQPRELLRAIPGLELVELKESDYCCGAAGSYSLTQPEMAGRLARRKLSHVDETGSQILAVANAGCILHLRQHAACSERTLDIVHPIDLLDRAYGLRP